MRLSPFDRFDRLAPPENVGPTDRLVRGVLAVWLGAVAVAAALDEQPTKAATAAIAAVGLAINWATGFCGGNALFGVDTTEPSESRPCRVD